MRAVLKHVFGATEGDIREYQHAGDNINHDPLLDFRNTTLCRLSMNLKSGVSRRLERVPFVLLKEDGFSREDSGLYRFFGEMQDWVLQNTAAQVELLNAASQIDYRVAICPRGNKISLSTWLREVY